MDQLRDYHIFKKDPGSLFSHTHMQVKRPVTSVKIFEEVYRKVMVKWMMNLNCISGFSHMSIFSIVNIISYTHFVVCLLGG
jgi:hypothetical protein